MAPARGRAIQGQYRVLLRHCLHQFVERETISAHAHRETSLAQTLGLLAVPAAFFTLVFRPFGVTGWTHIGLRYFFVCGSMAVIAFVVVLKWETLLPDRRDYLILTPLPIRMRTLFLAKVSALGLYAGCFGLALNLFGILFWPGIDGRPDMLRSLGAHALILLASGAFAAISAAAIQGVLMTLFRGAWLKRVSAVVQTGVLAALVMAVVLTPLMGPATRALAAQESPWLFRFPVYWFIGLYEQLRPSAGDAVLMQAGEMALPGLGVACAIFVLTYLPGYRRHSRESLDVPRAGSSGAGAVRGGVTRALHATVIKHAAERAVFHFISQSIARSMKHRVFLAAYGGLGAALTVFSFAAGRTSLLELPLTLSFILVSGLRAAFNVPSELAANWIVQISETSQVSRYSAAVKKWTLIFAAAPLFVLLTPLELSLYAWPVALYRIGFGFVLTAVLIEVLFFGFRKIPFTCACFPGKVNLVGLSALYIFGFTTYSSVMSGLEETLLRWWWAAAAALGVLTAIREALSRASHRYLEGQGRLDYSGGDGAFCVLEVGPAMLEDAKDRRGEARPEEAFRQIARPQGEAKLARAESRLFGSEAEV